MSESDIVGGRVAVVTITSLQSGDLHGVKVALAASELLSKMTESGAVGMGPVVDLARVNNWNVDPAPMECGGRRVSPVPLGRRGRRRAHRRYRHA